MISCLPKSKKKETHTTIDMWSRRREFMQKKLNWTELNSIENWCSSSLNNYNSIRSNFKLSETMTWKGSCQPFNHTFAHSFIHWVVTFNCVVQEIELKFKYWHTKAWEFFLVKPNNLKVIFINFRINPKPKIYWFCAKI